MDHDCNELWEMPSKVCDKGSKKSDKGSTCTDMKSKRGDKENIPPNSQKQQSIGGDEVHNILIDPNSLDYPNFGFDSLSNAISKLTNAKDEKGDFLSLI